MGRRDARRTTCSSGRTPRSPTTDAAQPADPHERSPHAVCAGASIGANATILPGVTIGRHAMVGAGAVVTRSVPPDAIVVGNPARIVGDVNPDGSRDEGRPRSRRRRRPLTLASCRIIELPRITDPRGNLTFIESNRHVPFEIRGRNHLYDVPGGESRGGHAHYQVQEFIIAASGSFDVIVDDGNDRKNFFSQPLLFRVVCCRA